MKKEALFNELFDLSGQTALITGGAGGLGKVIAEAYAIAGAKVALCGRNGKNAQAVAKEIADNTGAKTIGFAMDVREEQAVNDGIALTREELGEIDILLASAGWLMVDGFKKHLKLRKRQIPVTRRQVVTAILRGYFAFVYHCCSFISRYYLVTVPIVAWWSPPAALFVLTLHLIAGFVEFAIKKPLLNPFSFLFYFTLEQVSYQCGVWWACLQGFNFRPVLPRIVHKRIG